MSLTKNAHAQSLEALIDRISAGSDPKEKGPEVARITLWDGRIVTGSYYHGKKRPDMTVRTEIIWDDEKLKPLVHALLSTRKQFITSTGSHDTVCTLRWAIQGTARREHKAAA